MTACRQACRPRARAQGVGGGGLLGINHSGGSGEFSPAVRGGASAAKTAEELPKQ